MPNPKTKLAVIGLGMASKPHLAALHQLAPEIEVVGVFDLSVDRREEVAAQMGCGTFSSIENIALSDVDGAIVITPPNARSPIVEPLAEAGKAILMEKPVERDLARASALVERCEAAGVPLGIVLQHRYRAGAKALAELVSSGRVGPIYSAALSLPWWRDQSYYDQPGRGTLAMDGGGVLITQAIHVLDLLLSIAGSVVEVTAMTATTSTHKMECEDFATAGLRFASSAVGTVFATTASYPGAPETIELNCERASLRLTAGELAIHWRSGEVETIGDVTGTGGGEDPMDFPCDWHRDLIRDFCVAIQAGRQPTVSGRDALEVHKLIDAIERSAKSGQKVSVGAGE